MGVPLATTRITVRRSPPAQDFYDERVPPQVVARGVPAHISRPGGSESFGSGGRSESVNHPFGCDVTDITGDDEITDELTGERYQVDWVRRRVGLGLDHMVGALIQTEGVAT